MEYKTDNLPFKPRARMLLLLGDQLIRDAGIAVFELVKNAYDADSPNAIVTMTDPNDPKHGKIVIEDSGGGMDYETVTNVWLEPGTDYRVRQREQGIRTTRFGRLPLGEKGVGRFAAHKLGKQISLITKKKGQPEVVVDVNWQKFETQKYLSDVAVTVTERRPEILIGSKTGTRIEITQLRETWDRGMIRNLARSINSICSPFEQEGEFRAKLVLPANEDWLKGLLSVENVLDYALFRAKCDIKGTQLTYTYRFTPAPAMEKRVKPRIVERIGKHALNISTDNQVVDLDQNHVGPVHIDLYIFDRDPRILQLAEVSDKKGLKEFLNQSGGVRVYRDGIRVYDYGEPGNDWLDLGGQRINWPTQRISNNLVIGAVSLNLENSLDLKHNRGLIEKTNREGFVENAASRDFRDAVAFAITQIEVERNEDKTHIRNVYSSKKVREPVLEDLSDLRDLVEKKHLTQELGSYLDRIETDFMLIRDRFLTSASAGLSLSVVIHEVEKGVAELLIAVEREKATPRVKTLAKHLADLIEGFGSLIRRSGQTREKASSLITQALFNIEFRLRLHGIGITNESSKADFEIRCSRRLIVATLMNLIDNSIWWLENKWGGSENKKRIYIGTSTDLPDGPAIVIVDNGPGFMDPPEYLVEPFITRKPDGMGLGLHVADQVMKVQGGKLEFPEAGDLNLPKEFDGAAVALVFQIGAK
jgi:anti-sigma regulatory factor (Ser/Thr protein kinase)